MKTTVLDSTALLWTAALAMVLGFAALGLLVSNIHARGHAASARPAASSAAGAEADSPPPTPIM